MMANNEQSNVDFVHKDSIALPILFVFILLIISPIILFGIPDGFDLPQHFQFAQTFLDSIKNGDFFPQWAGNTNYGFGDVGIRFYPPLAHYFLAITQLFTNDWQTTAWINILFWMLLGSFGSFFFARIWLSPQNSLWVGILYAVAPYHLSQIYQFFLYSEFVAAAILPFCFLYLTKLITGGKWKDAIKLGFVCALMILSHIPTTIISFICLGIFAILILNWKNLTSFFPKLIFSGVAALCLTGFYWVRFVIEMNWVNHNSAKFSSGLNDFNNYLFPIYFIKSDYYLIKQMWFKDLVSIATILFILPIIVYVLFNFRDLISRKIFLALGLTSCFAFFMSSSLSSLLWANIGFLQKLQFPFRWLSVATLLGVLSFVLVFRIPLSKKLQVVKKYCLIFFFVVLALFNVTQIMLPAGLLTNQALDERLTNLREAESFDCWWTLWSDKKAFDHKEKVIAENRKVQIKVWETENKEFEVESGEVGNVRIGTFYYPHWKAVVNGQSVEVGQNSDGTISVPIPSETSKVIISFIEPIYLRLAKYFSLFSWIVLILGTSFLILKKFRGGLKLEIIS